MQKEFFINQLKIDEEFTDFFLVKAIAIRIGSNRKQYLDVTKNLRKNSASRRAS